MRQAIEKFEIKNKNKREVKNENERRSRENH